MAWETAVQCQVELLHQGVGEGPTPFIWFIHFIFDKYLIMISVKQGGSKYHFFGIIRPEIEPWSLEPLTKTLPTRTNSS